MRREGITHSLDWNIPDFSSLRAGRGDWYSSPLFNTFDRLWFLSIYPKGINLSSSGWVEVSLIRCFDEYPPVTLKARLSIKAGEGEEHRRERRVEFCNDDDECVWRNFCYRDDLETEERWMEGGSLTLSLRMERAIPLPAQDSSTQTVEETGTTEKQDSSTQTGTETEEHQSSQKQDASIQTDVELKEARASKEELSAEKQGVQKILEDMEKLLVSGNKSDIIVQVNETEFKVHSHILSARSPVLSAMLEHDMAEKASNKVCIDDCEPDIFEQYLRYLYTGSFHLPSQQTVFGLHEISDKYLADDLKILCLKHIRNTLSVQTFCNTVKLAFIHREDDLLQSAIDFASRNLQSILKTVEWQNFICENPMVANEIFIKCHDKLI